MKNAQTKNKRRIIRIEPTEFTKLKELVDSYSQKEQTAEFPKETMNRNIRDVLAHLHHWHLMMLDWYEVGMKREKPEMPAKDYTWKKVPELNRVIWEKYRTIELEEVRNDLNQSYQQLQKVIERHSNEELFEKKRFKWTERTSLGSYLVSATSSHYDWALKTNKKGEKIEIFAKISGSRLRFKTLFPLCR